MKKLICECCGGQINSKTMKCEYCGTQYKRDYEENTPQIIRVETYWSPVRELSCQIDVTELINAGWDAQTISDYAVSKMRNKLSEAIAPYIRMEIRKEYLNTKIDGRIKIIEPMKE